MSPASDREVGPDLGTVLTQSSGLSEGLAAEPGFADRSRGARSQVVAWFLERLRRRLAPLAGQTPLPDEPLAALREVAPEGDLPQRFVAAAQAAGCRVQRACQSTWSAAVTEILNAAGAGRVLLEADPKTALTYERAADLRAVLQAAGLTPVTSRDDETLFGVDAAITGVHRAVAETGTLICNAGPHCARGTSLIPPLHIAVVAESQLVGDLFDAFDELVQLAALASPSGLPANINLITGPSKTSDIEGVLVTGVHGPGDVHILLLA